MTIRPARAGPRPPDGLCAFPQPRCAPSPTSPVPARARGGATQAQALQSLFAEVPMRGLAWLLFVPVVAVYLAPALGLLAPALP